MWEEVQTFDCTKAHSGLHQQRAQENNSHCRLVRDKKGQIFHDNPLQVRAQS